MQCIISWWNLLLQDILETASLEKSKTCLIKLAFLNT